MGPPEQHPDFLRAVVDLSPGIMFVVDSELRLTFVNRAASDVLGYDPDEVLGRSVLEFLDPDWNPTAFESIATALGSAGGQRLPTSFRAITKSGARPIMQATANVQLADPVIGGVVVYAHLWTERWLLDRAFESVAAGDPIEVTMELLVEVAGAETLEACASFAYDRSGDAFGTLVADPSLPEELQGPAVSAHPELRRAWGEVIGPGTGVVLNALELPPELRAVATSAGFESVWAWPSDRDEGGVPAVWSLAWRREPHVDADESRAEMMARLATLAGLALSRSRNEEQNAHAAAHDALTGLWNRRAIFDHLTEAMADGGAGHGVGVVYLDLDHFKPVNDRYGHAAGDRMLREIARRLEAHCPEGGRVGRYGGDEFLHVAPARDLDDVKRLAAELRAGVDVPIELRSGEVVSVGASTGAAFAAPGTMTANDLVECADVELYRAKRRR